MKFHFSKIALLPTLATLLVFAACGKSRSGQESFSQIEDTKPVTMNQLFGNWSTNCEAVVPAQSRITVAKSRLVTFYFDRGGIYESAEFAYSDAFCRNRIFLNEGEGSFKIEAQGRSIAQLLAYQRVTPFTEDTAVALNRGRVCSFAAWSNGSPRDIVTTSCAPRRDIDSEAGMRETGELVMNLCSPKLSSTVKCEVLFFHRR